MWTGTHFVFEMAAGGNHATAVDFRQTGYDEQSAFFASNRDAWGQVLQNLKHVLESRST